MNLSTRVLLILLRIAIGWHLFVEGVDKLQSIDTGPTVTNRPWTSEPFLVQASGPLRSYYQTLAGDPDQRVLDLLTVDDPAKVPPRERLSPALRSYWNSLFARFVAHYQIAGSQLEEISRIYEGEKDRLGEWLVTGEKEVERRAPWGTYTIKQTTPQRLAEFRRLLQQLDDDQDTRLPAFGKDVLGRQLRQLRADIRALRTDLLADLDEQTNKMLEALRARLTPEQKARGPVPIEDQRPWTLVWTDRIVSWGLTLAGAGLILGLFTRFWCVAAALFLVTIYLGYPPWPGVPDNPRAEGHYLFVDKNLIEMLALLMLATTRSGKWVGLDGVVQFLNPFRRRPESPPADAA